MMWYHTILKSLTTKVNYEERHNTHLFLTVFIEYLDNLHQPQQVGSQPFLKDLYKLIDRCIRSKQKVSTESVCKLLDFHFKRREPLTVSSFTSMMNEIFLKKGPHCAKFIQNILDNKYEARAPLPFELVLGLVQHMFAKYESCDDNSVNFTSFTQDLFSLGLIYSKSAQDEFRIDNSDFYEFFSSPLRLRTLEVLLKQVTNKTRIPLLSQQDIEQVKKKISQLERFTLEALSFSTEINFNFLLEVIKRHQSPQLIQEMMQFFRLSQLSPFPYIVKQNDHFVKFILAIQRLQYPTEAQNSHSFFSMKIHSSAVTLQPSSLKYSAFTGFDLFAHTRAELLQRKDNGPETVKELSV
ncbi:hypothetical protein [Legionella hackeliae]|nr:hypothetical protein [Legionella hackeliae]